MSQEDVHVELLDDDQRTRLTTYHTDASEWIEQLPVRVQEYTRRWKLTLGPTFRPGGDASWAARAARDDGTPAVLKIAFPDSAEQDAVTLLRVLDGAGAVRLLEHDPDQHVTLLERCEPGTFAAAVSLAQADDAATVVFPPLWALSPAAIPDLPQQEEVAQQRAGMLRDRAEQFGDQLLFDGADLYDTLAASINARCVLHGDANQRNVLQSSRGWLTIDPRPMIGDPCSELALWVTTRLDEVAAPVERVVTLARRLGLPAERTLAWVAVQAALLCSWLESSGELGPLDTYRKATVTLLSAAT